MPRAIAWLRAELGVDAMLLGEWEPAATILDDFLRACEGRPHYMEPSGRVARAAMRLARGDVAGAHEDAERALEFARGAKDPQVLLPTLASAPEVELGAGRVQQASELADELIELCTAAQQTGTHAGRWTVLFAFALRALGRSGAFLATVPHLGVSTPWLEAAVAVAEGDPGRAAEILARIGARPDEAFARICAAEALVAAGRRPEADEQLAAALVICRELGADAWTRRAEALLAATG
jgi:tetratricopeptide (TPR) repeat protein